jgi:cytochrome P450
MAFGSGAHLCLGAAHARLILRTLLQKFTEQVQSISILESRDRVEEEQAYSRVMGYDSLVVALKPC